MNDFQKTAKEMLDFIEKSPTCFHAVANIGAMLEVYFQTKVTAICKQNVFVLLLASFHA